MNKLILIIFFFIGVAFSGWSQYMKITGTVYDSTGLKPVNKAVTMAVRIKDSLLLGFTRTNEKGEFDLKNIPIDTFNLIIAHTGYDNRNYFVFGSTLNNEINIPKVRLTIKSKEIEEVVIFANKNPIYYRGDTLIYVADSFKVGPNAVVEDLLKKLPGVKVDKDGAITSQGKEISQVLVDGDEFFGSDPTIATKNLAAKGVESVKVYEKKTTASAGDDATIQVMDLRLKANAKKGYFGKLALASDFQNYHEGELLLNKFDGNQKISVFALGSTTPRTNVSRADMNKFGLDNGSSSFMNGGGFNSNNSAKAAGVPKTFSSGIYYSDKIGNRKQTKIGFNYNYNNYELISSTASRSKYALPSDTSYYSDDSTHTIDLSETHKINFNLGSQIDSLTFISFAPSVNISSGNLSTSNLSDFLDETNNLSRNSNIENITNSKGISLDNTFNITKRFMKPKRMFSVNYDISASRGNSIGTMKTTNSYIAISGTNDTIAQQKTNATSAQTHIATFTYTEPIFKKMKLEFEYLVEYGLSSQNKETKDGINGVYSSINTGLTNNFENTRKQNRVATSLIYESRTQTITATLRARNIDIDNQNITTSTTIHQNISNFLPKFSYNFKPSQSKRFNFTYNTKSSQPAINDLQLVQNNTNPNKIVVGNPDLKPTYEHNLNINFNNWQALTGKYIWFGFNNSLTNNAFANSTTYDQYGRSISQTVNVNGNINSTLNASAGFPLFNKRLEISPSIAASYSKYSNIVSDNRNITTTSGLTPELEFEISLDSLEFTIGGKYTYNNPKNSIGTIATNPYSIQVYSADFVWTLPSKFKISSDATYTINSQRANGYNINYFVWNASISRTFTTTDNFVISLIGNDILNQNISALRTVNGNITTDNRTKIISRYFLLKLVYKFNNNKTKEEDAKGGWH